MSRTSNLVRKRYIFIFLKLDPRLILRIRHIRDSEGWNKNTTRFYLPTGNPN